jgi:anti-sigma B factor antagonist
MTIEHELLNKSTVVLSLSGRLDTANAPLLERKIKQWGKDITELVLDFSELFYISSMGLRVLLQAKKELKQEGRKLTIKNMSSSIKEVFEMTGFLGLMVQEEKFVVVRKKEPAPNGASAPNGADSIILSLNGQMQSENIAMITKELSEIKEANLSRNEPLTVILDMENLSHIAPAVGYSLEKAIEETKWAHRKLSIRNPSKDIRAILKMEGLGAFLE